MNIIGKRKLFLGFSGGLVLISLFLVVFLGLKQGIDLRGGTQWQVEFENQSVNEDLIKSVFAEEVSDLEILVKRASDGSFIIRLSNIDEAKHQSYLLALKTLGDVREKSFASIGPAIGSELRRRAVWAIIAALLAISIYIAWAFRKVSKPIKSWKYGVVTLVTLFHDVIIPTGLLAVLGAWKGIEIDTNFIVALLVVMGFSVHDTIVVFDRIREKIRTSNAKNFVELVNLGLNETLVRSFNTSLTAILALLAIYFWGSYTLHYFILAMLIGIAVGTYSSIAIASPMIVELWLRQEKKKS